MSLCLAGLRAECTRKPLVQNLPRISVEAQSTGHPPFPWLQQSPCNCAGHMPRKKASLVAAKKTSKCENHTPRLGSEQDPSDSGLGSIPGSSASASASAQSLDLAGPRCFSPWPEHTAHSMCYFLFTVTHLPTLTPTFRMAPNCNS